MNTVFVIFAGGCFWCMQPVFDAMPGVVATEVGYTGGAAETASYASVSAGDSGHVEAIKVTYDPTTVTYKELLKAYFENIDPFDAGGQFADRGEQYQTVVFYSNEEEYKEAEAFKQWLSKKFDGREVATKILPAGAFYAAEEYHQKYYEKNSAPYNRYKYGSGRVDQLKELWGSETGNQKPEAGSRE